MINLFKHKIPETGENFYTLLERKNLKITKIVSSNKLEDKLYCQDEDEFVVLIDGKATLDIDGKKVLLQKGDTLLIPAKTKHRILSTTKGTIWIAIYFM